ncbi:transcriptional regulator [Halobacillus andaensis]|uniref:Transcriptional regulator n=1 Tax=Halobacillus andaensis TaxID=1176239 RepID=A0A917B6J5_HALAA|nr:WYL domain-containing protein [Halobacillus andaensis]MBP2006454.1 putative DNA-binding transcriptional regulator YafY [Halobacillus andaensis]GGF27499.1 transcriptional regulator [Halobacillus andaensis]
MELNSNTRMLKLRDILFEETDEYHELSMQEITDKMKLTFGPDASFDSRTLKRDMEVLEDTGFEVIKNTGRFGKVYYSYQDRVFETYQLRLINDALLSAKFITEKEKKELIEKTKQLTSKHIAKTLPDPMLFSQSANDDYQLVKLSIDHVHRAISERKVLHYQYGKYNMKKEFEFHRDGSTYEVEPYALIWQNDFYYLIGRFKETDEMRHYRLDRMRNIRLSEERFQRRKDFNTQDYVSQSFHMFAGENVWVKIEFDQSLINVVLDRFGHDAHITPSSDDHFILSTKAKMSTGLVNWILTWGRKAKVLSPDGLVEEVQEEIEAMYARYKSE